MINKKYKIASSLVNEFFESATGISNHVVTSISFIVFLHNAMESNNMSLCNSHNQDVIYKHCLVIIRKCLQTATYKRKIHVACRLIVLFHRSGATLASCVGRQALISRHYLQRGIAGDIWPILDTTVHICDGGMREDATPPPLWGRPWWLFVFTDINKGQ